MAFGFVSLFECFTIDGTLHRFIFPVWPSQLRHRYIVYHTLQFIYLLFGFGALEFGNPRPNQEEALPLFVLSQLIVERAAPHFSIIFTLVP